MEFVCGVGIFFEFSKGTQCILYAVCLFMLCAGCACELNNPPWGCSVVSSLVSQSFLSSQSRFRVIQNFLSRVRAVTWSSQSRVTRIVESLRVIGLQALFNVESHETSRFFYDTFLLLIGTQHAIKWSPISQKMAPNMLWNGADKLENGVQCCFNKVWLQVIHI